MAIRLLDGGWSNELIEAQRADATALKNICPFIKARALARLLSGHPKAIQVTESPQFCPVKDCVSVPADERLQPEMSLPLELPRNCLFAFPLTYEFC